MKRTIYLDLDGMVANLTQRLLDDYHLYERPGTHVKLADIWTTRGPNGRFVSDYCHEYLKHDGIFDDLGLIPGALWAYGELCKLGHVVIASSPSCNHDSATAKIRWATKHLGIHRRDIVLIAHKHLLRGDAFFEDWGPNIQAIRKTNPGAFIGAIAYPYNSDAFVNSHDCLNPNQRHVDIDRVSGFHCRAEGVNDFEGAWKTLIGTYQELVESSYIPW
jgi:5'(3')-deoxyribonucleotidase